MSQQRIPVGDLTVCYETFGDPADPPLLLVMGLAVQLTSWEPEFCQAFADQGFFVIRYDHRDVGLSSPVPDEEYSLSDLAGDAAGLLTALGIERAHLLGVSMGGMIAQLVAIEHPTRVLSLCSVMSTTGNPADNPTPPEAIAVMRRNALELPREESVEDAVVRARFLAGTAFPFDEDRIRRRAAAAYDRANYPQGKARHLRAARTADDRTARLATIGVPTVVIHGDADPLVLVSGGRATAAAIPGARFVTVRGMGHELPREVEDRIVEAVASNAARAGFRPRGTVTA
ncbi:alpha/beta fold hydrolase [Nocardioides sp. QY071]|uniref:alpha/beta fold hydrolase n=1 Tax=Nocardioides sp. QY071 TaxID=3044187 RepID=UPI00249C979A|nr:alpha/beta fold hydrolase [Nocardioides sp. QY071]WGY00361.1 alpha/beta fold hydrolase [Nocardioides sp. QY071]